MSDAVEGAKYKTLLQQAYLSLDKMQTELKTLTAAQREPIAVIGMSCRFPGGANSPQEFWQLLTQSQDAISEIPANRWDINQFFDPNPDEPGKIYTRWGGFLKDIDQFDANFFGISPREAHHLDPQQRLVLEVAWEALENTGTPLDRFAGTKTGVFIGISTNDYGQVMLSNPTTIDIYTGTGISNNVLAGRISYLLDLQGPCTIVDTACSSSLVALHLACQSLRNQESSMALVGGVNLMLIPGVFLVFSKARMMSPNGRCRTFDAQANGYVRGEGCGMVVLKRLSEAVKDGDRILALIRGSAINQDGRSGGLTAPNVLAQRAVIRQSLANAGLKPAQISYVEAHGTGTPLGDPIEIEGLKPLYGLPDEAAKPCFVGSVKTNIGHLEAAAGMASLIKTILMLQNHTIPRSLHFQQLNPNISLTGTRLAIATEQQAWNVNERYAAISSFGWSGTNGHVILAEAPSSLPKLTSPTELTRPYHLLTLSAQSPKALTSLATRYAQYIDTNREMEVADICFSANTGRNHRPYRWATVASSPTQLQAQLQEFAAEPATSLPRHYKRPKVGWLFTGQGSQYASMSYALFQTQPYFQQVLRECDEILRPYLAQPLLSVLSPGSPHAALINETAYTQPALFAVEYALAKLWQSWGIMPDALMGHSVGEYVAACLAGVFSLADGLRLVAERGRLIQSLPQDGKMAAIFTDQDYVTQAIAPYLAEVSIAAINDPENIVISGQNAAIDKILAKFAQEGISYQLLKVSHAFHSPLMTPMVAKFAQVADSIAFIAPQLTLISNLTGQKFSPQEIPNSHYWQEHIKAPVQFLTGMQSLAAEGCELFIEIGPHPVLIGMGQRCLLSDSLSWLPSLKRNQDDWNTILASLAQYYCAGGTVDWVAFDRDYSRNRVSLPTYAWDRERYWAEDVSFSAQTVTPVPDWTQVIEIAQQQSEQAPLDLGLSSYPHWLKQLEQLVNSYILQALQKLGVYQQANEYYTPGMLLAKLQPLTSYVPSLSRWLTRLAQAGLLKEVDGSFSLAAEILPQPDFLKTTLVTEFPAYHAILQLVKRCGEKLADILVGKENPAKLLFEGEAFGQVQALYRQADMQYFINIIRTVCQTRLLTGRTINILVWGDISGEITNSLLPLLNTHTHYYYCDNTTTFLEHARQRFSDYPMIQYHHLDWSQELASQGFVSRHFDLVIAAHSLHTSDNLPQRLAQLQTLLTSQGLLLAWEITDAPAWVETTFALLADWQQYQDDLRSNSSLMATSSWLTALTAAGFKACVAVPQKTSLAKILGQDLFLAQNDKIDRVALTDQETSYEDNKIVSQSVDLQEIMATAESEREPLIQKLLIGLLAKIMRLSVDRLPLDILIRDLGFESLMIVEFRNRLKRLTGINIPLDDIPALTISALISQVSRTVSAPGYIWSTQPTIPSTITSRQSSNIVEKTPSGATVIVKEEPVPPNANPWLVCRKPKPNAQLRLFAFPHAGGSAVAFHSWADELAENIELVVIQLPGRSERLKESPFKRLSLLVPALVEVLTPYLDRPYAFFGHSMGALISFELIRQLRKRGATLPQSLFVASRRAPQLLDNSPPIHMLPEAKFLAALQRYGGIEESLLKETELIKLLLPTLRADFAILETYVYASEAVLELPITVFGGIMDSNVTETSLQDWQAQTSKEFQLQMFTGNHFFLREHYKDLCQTISQQLNRLLASSKG